MTCNNSNVSPGAAIGLFASLLGLSQAMKREAAPEMPDTRVLEPAGTMNSTAVWEGKNPG